MTQVNANISSEFSFKTCPCCSHSWTTQEAFFADSDLEFNGYQVGYKSFEGGMFFFTHTAENCHSTLTVKLADLKHHFQNRPSADRKQGHVKAGFNRPILFPV